MIQHRAGAKTAAWVAAVLSAAAAVAMIFGVYLALASEDTEPLESALLLSVARQLLRSPWELYGPFGGSNPLVIIHGPIYYHLAAFLAWPLYRAGLNPVTAALAAGRSLSGLGLVWTLVFAYRLARLERLPRVVGWWAALLIAASPVIGVMPYTVRPDMLGVALQTTGVFLVLSVLCSERPTGISLAAAFAAFGLAVCVKQHYVPAAAISTFFLFSAWLRGRLPFNLIARGLLTGLTIPLVVYGTEELATEGRMSRAVFQAAASVSAVHPGDWMRGVIVIFAIMGKNSGLIVVMAAAGLAAIGSARGIGRRALVLSGTVLTGAIAARTFAVPFEQSVSKWEIALAVTMLTAIVVIVIPACYLLSPQPLTGSRVDRALWIYLAAELAVVSILARMSTGAWLNYGIQAVVFFGVLTARVLWRVFENAPMPRALLTIGLAALVVLIGSIGDAMTIAGMRRVERLALTKILDEIGGTATELFFVARPGDNRVNGRLDLVYDDWLYPVFESIHQAEPRSTWLRHALTVGTIRYVVNTSDSPNIDGLGEPLPRLGYVRDFMVGPFYVWRRSALVGVARPK
jgi:hypothetical protein